MTELLLADFLVVDARETVCREKLFRDRAGAALRAAPSETCGGRSLNDDIVESLYTLLVNGGNGPRIRDGVDQATAARQASFPYLVRPNPAPPDLEP